MEDPLSLDRRHAWHPFTPIDEWLDPAYEPVMIESGLGATLTDTRGRAYLDGNSSIWTNLHGHNHPRLTGAVAAQLGKISHSSYLGLGHGPGSLLAARLCRAAGFDPGRAFLSDDGSTAMEVALKIAFQYFAQNGQPARQKFVTLGGGYHGDTVGAMSIGRSAAFHGAYRPLLFPTEAAPMAGCYRCPHNRARPERADARSYRKCGWECVDDAARALEKTGAETAALIAEPKIQGAAGMVFQPEGYLAKVAPLVKETGALLIVDEVFTGFGRTGAFLASQAEGVAPDLMALSKGLTAGLLPMGATLVREPLFDGFRGGLERTFFHGHSYSGNQLGCAAALANLDLFEEEQTLSKVARGAAILKEASQAFWELPQTGDVRQEGMVLAVELVRDRATREPFPSQDRLAHRINERARAKGLLARGLGATLFLIPPYCSTEEELRRMVAALLASAREVLN